MTPKITYISGCKNGSNAIYKLMENIVRSSTRSRGRIIQLHKTFPRVFTGNKVPLGDCVVDSPYNTAYVRELGAPRKLIAMMHSIENSHMEAKQAQYLGIAQPDLVLVTSGEDIAKWVRSLGHNAEHIPISIDPDDKFVHQPYPEEFAIGFLGANMRHKRFDLVQAAGEAAGVKVVGSTRNDHEGGEFIGNENEFYKSISCYVSATECEHAPFPTLEALLCGRPLVIPDKVVSPPELLQAVRDGAGIIANTDVERVNAIQEIRDNFEYYASNARKFNMRNTGPDYETAILEEIER